MFYLRAYQKNICSKCNNTSSELDKNKVCPTCKKIAKSTRKINARLRAALPKEKKSINQTKLDMINRLGGKCVHCGYSRYLSALEFHHIDPTTKVALVSKLISQYNTTSTVRNYELLVAEVDKCLLLCSNCHAAKHYGDW